MNGPESLQPLEASINHKQGTERKKKFKEKR